MMKDTFPSSSQADEKKAQELVLFDYVSDKKAQRNKVFLQQNLLSLLEQGEKIVHYANNATTITPNQFEYFLQRKMELATSLLLQNENPGEVFHKIGFENHSSFSQSFKQVYGISPKQFQQQKMTFPQQSLID